MGAVKKNDSKFGFGLMQSRDLKLADAWTQPVIDIQIKDNSVMRCISCGSCAASCSSSSNASVCKAILLLRRGLIADARNALGGCLFCGKCRFVCPMGVNTRGVIAALLN